jgi:hypothetical protein
MIRRHLHLDDCPRASVRNLLAETLVSLHCAYLDCTLGNTGEPLAIFHSNNQQKTARFSLNCDETATSGKPV